jgi:lipid-binding SYLF domain-containing protein
VTIPRQLLPAAIAARLQHYNPFKRLSQRSKMEVTMENNRHCRSFFNRKGIALLAAVALMVGIGADVASAKTAKEINTSVDACLDRFYKEINGGKELAGKAKGVLVLPGVIKAEPIVGGEFGEGALRVGGKTVSCYSLAAGSVGFQIGGDTKDIIIMFMTDAALKQFQSSKGWEVGVDNNVLLVNIGGGERLDFTKLNDPIVAFVFDVKGLMADVSLKGAKLTKVAKK